MSARNPASSTPIMARLVRTQAIFFVFLVLGVLFSFAAVPGNTPASVAEQFRWRTDFVRGFATFRLWAGDRLFNNTLVGKDGWLYYDGGYSFREYQRTDRFAPKDLNAFQHNLDRLNSALAAQGRTFLFVILPNKTSIYPQYMPDEIPIIGQVSRTDQLMDYLRSNSTTPALDLRSALLAESAAQQTYYRTDSHWNDLGAYYGYYGILSTLSRTYPGLRPHPLSDYTFQVLPTTQTDLPPLMGYLSLRESDPFLFPRFPVSTSIVATDLPYGYQMRVSTNPSADLPTLLFFGDSFYYGLEKFLTPDFSRVVDLPYYDAAGPSLRYWVDREKPDIVILECVERDLDQLFPLLQSIQP